MARLSTYNVDTDVSKTDLLIGTDSSSGTKNFPLQSIAEFLNESSLLNVNGQVIYKFEASTNTPSAGTFVISGGGSSGSNLNSISHLIFHHLNSNQNNIAQYLNYFNGLFVMLTQTDDQNTFALYSATVSSNTANQTDFYLSFIEGNGVITGDKYYALSYSPKGQTDKTFISNEISFNANSPVTINHNLNKFPSVTTVDTTGAHIIGDVQHINANSFKITFNVPFSAKVYAN
jgi:hypothetical protein